MRQPNPVLFITYL